MRLTALLPMAVPIWLVVATSLGSLAFAADTENMPIADAHVHYSHDSVELTPPERVIELMRAANLKLALVSSSDDKGTQLLSAMAPDLIVPGLRPYRRRGELQTWYKDPEALAYVEGLLARNRYASIGEFHLFGADAELAIPRRIVELAEKHNLVLHAHSDADAISRMLAQSETVKVLWAHSGFESPDGIAEVLRKHDRLWADLAFRSDVGSGGSLSHDWKTLFTEFPGRIMLGTDTYTPERMYFLPEHASNARQWLSGLPQELAERVAWRNAHELLMPVWQANRIAETASQHCLQKIQPDEQLLAGEQFTVGLVVDENAAISSPFSVKLRLCGDYNPAPEIKLDASMPAHGHGMNYQPEVQLLASESGQILYRIDGLIMHMPGAWEWSISITADGVSETIKQPLEMR